MIGAGLGRLTDQDIKRVVVALLAMAALFLYGIVGAVVWSDDEDDLLEDDVADPVRERMADWRHPTSAHDSSPPETTEGPTGRG